MLKAKDFRHEAWNKLSGKWGTMALTTLILEVIVSALGALSAIGVGAVGEALVLGPLTLGFTYLTLNVVREQSCEIKTLFDGFSRFVDAFLLSLVNGIFILLWTLLFIIPGIIKSYAYSMSFYIMADTPGITFTEARKASIQMMKGNKWRLFCLHFSFIGWFLLCLLTFGILSFWVMPYMQSAEAAFYQSLVNEKNNAMPNPAALGAEEPFQSI